VLLKIAALAFASVTMLAVAQQAPPSRPLDAALQTAIDALAGASGYRFDVGGNALYPYPLIAPLAATRGPMASLAELAEFMVETEIQGRFERGKPLFLGTGPIRAFRADRKIVYRRRIRGEWGPWSELNRLADDEERETHRLLRLIAWLPTPEDLLADLGARTTTCTRTDDRKREGIAVFECQLLPDAGWMLPTQCSHRPAGPTMELASSTLRITVDHGKLTELELESRAPIDAPRSAAIQLGSQQPGESTAVARYHISSVGATKVAVPGEAARLLGAR
jgi:hypothetical protein